MVLLKSQRVPLNDKSLHSGIMQQNTFFFPLSHSLSILAALVVFNPFLSFLTPQLHIKNYPELKNIKSVH